MSTVAQHPSETRQSDSDMSHAWRAVLAIPVCVILSFVAGVVTLSAFGYSSGGNEPLWVDLIVDLVVLVILLAPCVAAIVFGTRARRSGAHGAAIPIVIGAVVGAAGIILTVATTIGDALH